MFVVLMGVSGSGKSTVGTLLAQKLRVALTDEDRAPSNKSAGL